MKRERLILVAHGTSRWESSPWVIVEELEVERAPSSIPAGTRHYYAQSTTQNTRSLNQHMTISPAWTARCRRWSLWFRHPHEQEGDAAEKRRSRANEPVWGESAGDTMPTAHIPTDLSNCTNPPTDQWPWDNSQMSLIAFKIYVRVCWCAVLCTINVKKMLEHRQRVPTPAQKLKNRTQTSTCA